MLLASSPHPQGKNSFLPAAYLSLAHPSLLRSIILGVRTDSAPQKYPSEDSTLCP